MIHASLGFILLQIMTKKENKTNLQLMKSTIVIPLNTELFSSESVFGSPGVSFCWPMLRNPLFRVELYSIFIRSPCPAEL